METSHMKQLEIEEWRIQQHRIKQQVISGGVEGDSLCASCVIEAGATVILLFCCI